MSKMLVVVFEDEVRAYQGRRALVRLHDEGSISLYATAIFGREEGGTSSTKDDVGEGPVGTAVGIFVGALIGVLGSVGGVINLGIGVDFLNEVGARLNPGKAAVVAEIGESWSTPVDAEMESLGGEVFRRYRADVEDELLEWEVARGKSELRDMKQALHSAEESAKDSIRESVAATRAKLAAAADRARERLEFVRSEGEAKVRAIKNQIAQATIERKASLEARADKIKADYEVRTDKLKQALQLTKQALAA